MIDFFIALDKIPTTTQQQHRVTWRDGKPLFFNSKKIKNVKDELSVLLMQYAPREPIHKPIPIELLVRWQFGYKTGRKDDEYKTTRPDLDNMLKLPADIMTELGFWDDDSQLADVRLQKVWHKKSGIYIKIKELQRT